MDIGCVAAVVLSLSLPFGARLTSLIAAVPGRDGGSRRDSFLAFA